MCNKTKVETDVLNMMFQRFLRTTLKILNMILKMKTDFSKMLFRKCDFHENEKMRISLQKSAYTAENDESLLKTSKNACLPLCDAFLESPT